MRTAMVAAWGLASFVACAHAPAPAPAPAPARAPAPAPAPAEEGTVERLRDDARALRALVQTPLARQLLDGAASLPHVPPHAIFRTADKKRWYTEAAAGALPENDRRALVRVDVDVPLYYETKYGSPLAYARVFEVLGEHGLSAGIGSYADFGYGGVGSLAMMAAGGWRATGVDVDPMLPALYAGPPPIPAGVTLLDGRFPADANVVRAVGGGLDLFLSKNTLKRGYIHPDRPADPRLLIDLGVSDEAFLRAVHDALAPGATFLLYNVCPAPTPPDKPFVPWSDGRSPFARAAFEAAGFEVVEFDHDDTAAMRALGKALRWDQGEDAMDLEHDLSVLYTLARRVR